MQLLERPFKVGFPFTTELTEFDPARVQRAGQYALLENLYTPLLEQDEQGQVIPGAASSFRWVGDEIEFTMREGMTDSEGVPLTVEDAYFSLMRLLILGSSTHGDLQKLICAKGKPAHLTDPCEGIRIYDGTLRLKPLKRNFSIFKNFASIDFSIVPRRSVSAGALDKINLSITSGPYYIKHRKPDGSLELGVNKRHFHYSERMPQNVIFIPTLGGLSGVEQIKTGQVDFLTHLDQSDIGERIVEFSDSPLADVHATLPVRLELLVFTEKGLKLPEARRWNVSNKIAKVLSAEKSTTKGFEKAIQYFPPSGIASLESADLEVIDSKRTQALNQDENGKGLTIGLFPTNFQSKGNVFQTILPDAVISKLTSIPAYSSHDQPDLYLVSMDTGFQEDLPNVVNSLKSGFLGKNKTERDAWLTNYLSTDSEAERIGLLKKLHFESLKYPVVIPILRSPYVSVLRKPWKSAFSYLFPNCPVWKIYLE